MHDVVALSIIKKGVIHSMPKEEEIEGFLKAPKLTFSY